MKQKYFKRKLMLYVIAMSFGVIGIVGCNKQEDKSQVVYEALEVDEEGVEKPSHIKIAVDSSFPSVAQGRNEIINKFKTLTGIELEILDLDMRDEMPEVDVVMIGRKYYSLYAQQEYLIDITTLWENSALKASNRIKEEAIEALYQEGHLYGFPVNEGQGCITYMRKDWLDQLGLEIPTNFDEYQQVLEQFTYEDPDDNGKDDTYGVTASGLINSSEPYVQNLPEFWQDAYPAFYQNEAGEWVDGFTEEKTKEAIKRLQSAYQDRILDQEVISNILSVCRDKFYSGKVGAITDKAGTWSKTLEDNLKLLQPEAELIAIEPIEELHTYKREAPAVLAMTGDCKNPEGVFKYFISAILDGSEIQRLFTYGVEGIHYEQTDTGYQMLKNVENEAVNYEYVLIDPTRSIANWINGDPFEEKRSEMIKGSSEILNEHSEVLPLCKSDDVLGTHEVEITDCKNIILSRMITGELSIEQGMIEYENQVGDLVQEVLNSLNQSED